MKSRLVVAVFIGVSLFLFVVSVISTPAPVAAYSDRPALASSVVQATLLVTRYAYLPLLKNEYIPCTRLPTLSSPANGAHLTTLVPTLVYMRGTAPVSQTLIYIADNSNFNAPQVYGTSGGSYGPFSLKLFDNLQPATQYYWRVRDQCGTTYSPYSTVFTFTTGSGGVLLPAPILVKPITGTIGLIKPVTLTWNIVSGAAGYQVHYGMVGSGGYTLVETGGTSYVLNYLSPNSQYEWWVVAFNSYAYGATSPRWRFTTGTFATMPQQEDSSVPEVELITARQVP